MRESDGKAREKRNRTRENLVGTIGELEKTWNAKREKKTRSSDKMRYKNRRSQEKTQVNMAKSERMTVIERETNTHENDTKTNRIEAKRNENENKTKLNERN